MQIAVAIPPSSVCAFGPVNSFESTGSEKPFGPTDTGRKRVVDSLRRVLPRLPRAWATAAELATAGLEAEALSPPWFERWETWQTTFLVATPWALEAAGLVVDEREDEVPRYFLDLEAARPRAHRVRRERGRVYDLDLSQFAAPEPEPAIWLDEDGAPVILWGQEVPVDRRL